jgi:glycosyltransferase involved in cell wall biosynthesis
MSTHPERLRVAMVGTSLRRGGAENQSVCVARAMIESGVDVRFFYLGSGGYYEKELQALQVPIQQIYFPNRPWKILFHLMRTLRRWRPHIVLAFQFGDLAFAGPAGRVVRALVLGGVQSNGWYELHHRRSGIMLCLAHGILPNSYGARRTLALQGVNLRKMDVLANVLDLRQFDIRKSLPDALDLPRDRIIVAAVGSLQPVKRFDRFLEALALARRHKPALFGVIAGGDLGAKGEIEARAHELGLIPDGVRFVGEIDNVPGLLGRSAMLVLSSDHEGLPNVILEAMAARLPVITTAVGDASRVVANGDTGYVVEPDDIAGMAARMVWLAQSHSLRKELGEAGRKRVEQEYNHERLAGRLADLFHGFAQQHHKRALCRLLKGHSFAKRDDLNASPSEFPSAKKKPASTLQSDGLSLEA